MSTPIVSDSTSPTTKQRWLYSLANLGHIVPAQMVGFVLFFFTDVKRLPVAVASGVMFAYSIWDAVNVCDCK